MQRKSPTIIKLHFLLCVCWVLIFTGQKEWVKIDLGFFIPFIAPKDSLVLLHQFRLVICFSLLS